MKKLLATALVTIAMLLAATSAFATEVPPKNTAKTTVKVGYLEDYGIITTPIVQGSEGYGYEYLEQIEAYTDYEFYYVQLSWAEGLKQLKSGEIDILAPASMSEARKADYDFVETLFSTEETNIYSLQDASYHYGDPQQLEGKIIGAMEGSIYAERFKVYAQAHGLAYTLKYVEHADAAESIASGEIDFYVDGSLALNDALYSVERILTENLYLMTTKGNDTLTTTINDAMLALEVDDPFYNELLWYKYYASAHKATQMLTANETAALQCKDVFTVGYHADLHPISYTSAEGEPEGYSIDIMNLLADELGIQVRYVPLHDGSGTHSDEVDFSLCPLKGDCSAIGTLSQPYDMQNLLVVKDKGLKKDDVKNIQVKDYATIQIDDFLQQYPFATIHKSYSSTDSQRIYDAEHIDCLIIPDNSEVIIYDRTVKSVQVLDVSLPIGIMVSSQLPQGALTALNKAIESLSESTVDEIIVENMVELQATPTLKDTLMQYQWQLTSVFLLVVAAFIYILLESRRKTKRLLEVDTLTGTMSQYKFAQEAKHRLQTAKPNEYMMMLLDVDKFKTINKVYGIAQGDKLLRVLADSLRRQTQTGAIIGRLQSDAFAILTKASEISPISQNDKFTDERYIKELKQIGIDIPVYCSIGAYVIENTAEDISYIIDNARTAKGYGKAIFGNTIHYFTKALQAKHDKESAILSSMEAALKNEEFFIVVQPKLALQTGQIVGGEVLVRWQKQDGTFVYPDEFIPLMEENKFIVHLDRYVLEKTCELIRDSKQTLPVLSVNVSATTMLEPDFMALGHAILQRYGVIPQQLEVELTESVLDADYKHICAVIAQLKKIGVAVAIDDFGKGASSLARIKEIEMDVLKLDKDFMEHNAENEKGKLVLKNIISMANDLGITSLAEGIETKEQKDLLIQLGCEQGQGYHFDKPLPTAEFIQKVQENSKAAFEPALRYQKNFQFWNDSNNLSYGVAVVKNDVYATVVQANDAFYDVIGHSKDSFKTKHNNRFVSVLVDNLANLIKKHLAEQQYDINFDCRVLTSTGEIVWTHEIIKYSPTDDLFFITLIKIADQNYLMDSTVVQNDFLQQSKQVSQELATVLDKIRDHYNSDRAYFVQFGKDNLLMDDYQEALQPGVVSQKGQFKFAQLEYMQPLVAYLKNANTVYMDVASVKNNPAYQTLVDAYESSGTAGVIYAAIKDANNHFWGFVGVDNPKQGVDSVQMLEIEASYIGAYLVQNEFNQLAKQNRIQEEGSKAGIVNLCINMLRTTSVTNTATTTTILELLREHYNARACAIVRFYPAEKRYEICHMHTELAQYTHLDIAQNLSYSVIEKIIERFEQNKYALLKCNTEDFFDAPEDKRSYETVGGGMAYLAPLFDINNNCNGMLLVTNPRLSTRSPMLVQVVAKFLSDYQAKHDIYLEQQSKMATEPMTGLLNKVATEQTIQTLLQQGKTGTLYMVDVDNFKQINDKLGHAKGDNVIAEHANLLREIFRKEDVVGRIGGDEFIVFAPDLTTAQTIAQKANQVVTAFEKTYAQNGVEVQISASVGVCTACADGQTFQQLYKQADKALYRAKAQGKNQFCIAKEP